MASSLRSSSRSSPRSSPRYQRIEDFGLGRTRVDMEDYIANYSVLLAGIDPHSSLRRYSVRASGGREVHTYNVSVRTGTYVVTGAFFTHHEDRGSRRTTRMRLHQMILANFFAARGDPRRLNNIVFTEITNSVVQDAINRDFRDLCRLGDAHATSSVVSMVPDYFEDWQAHVNRNPFLRCVVHLVEEINRQNPEQTLQIREVRYSPVESWENVDYGYHMAVSLGPPTTLALIRSQPQPQPTVPQYTAQDNQYNAQGSQGWSQQSYGGYNVNMYNYQVSHSQF